MYPKLIEELIEHFVKLPGIGRRSAERIVFWLLTNPQGSAAELSNSIMNLKQNLRFCRECKNLSEAELCRVCVDQNRDRAIICVVEEHKHLIAIERTGTYKGIYFVLLGAISPAEGRGPDDLKIHELRDRIIAEQIKEVVIATDPDTEGEMTALHITNELRSLGIKISRIGLGIPVGSSVEYADLSTLTMSMATRREL
ncbi:MAG: recombination protein RecR [Candidatus Omnitrophica bacterium]|nr:recombination protein RecR [Candidatus Omnitrophota bacterium]